jgi:hypothetical protein
MSGHSDLDRMRDLVEGRLSIEEASRLRAEVASDAETAALLDAMESVHALTAADAVTPPPCGATFEQFAAAAGIAGPSAATPVGPMRLLRRPLVAAAVAAVLLAAVAVAATMLRTPTPAPEVALHAIPLQPVEVVAAPEIPDSLAAFRPVVDGDVRWLDSLDAALPLARATGRPMLLYIFHPTCPWCMEMNSVAFKDEGVLRDLQWFIPVRVNVMETDETMRARLQAGWPYFGVLGVDGTTLSEFPGFQPPEDFVRHLTGFLDVHPVAPGTLSFEVLGPLLTKLQIAEEHVAAGREGRAWSELTAVFEEAPSTLAGRAARATLDRLRDVARIRLQAALAVAGEDPVAGAALLRSAEASFAGSDAAADFLAVRLALEGAGRSPNLVPSPRR